jgi:hypothetical protein
LTSELAIRQEAELPIGLSYADAKRLRKACDDDPFLFLRLVCGYDKLSTYFHAPIVYMLSGHMELLNAFLTNPEFLKRSFTAREIKSVLATRHKITDLSSIEQYKRASNLFDFINLRVYRGSGKSSIAHGIDAWEHAIDPQNTILICSAAEDRAVSFTRQVRHIYEGEVFSGLYPDRIEGSVLTDRRISLAGRKPISPQAGIEAWGYTASIVGGHFNIFSIDDLTIDSNIFDVTDGIPRFLSGISGLYEPRRIRRRHMGTVWDELDDHSLLSRISSCFTIVAPIEDFGGEPPEDIRYRGEPTNPEWHSSRQIADLQREILADDMEGPRSWRRNYMLDPTAGGGRMFTRALIDRATWYPKETKDERGITSRFCVIYAKDAVGEYILEPSGEYKTRAVNVKDLVIYIGCDQSVSDEGDEWGVAVLGRSPIGETFILDTRKGQGYERMLNAVLSTTAQWGPVRIGLEKGGMQNSTLYWMYQDPRFSHIKGLLEGVGHGNQEKSFRIANTVVEPMRIDRMYVKHEDNIAIPEMLKYKPSDKASDGVLDAISIASSLTKTPPARDVVMKANAVQKSRYAKRRNPITGIFTGFRVR